MSVFLDPKEVMEERFVAFVDILGFKDLVKSIELENSPSNPALRSIESILNFMDEETYDPNYGTDLPIYKETQEGLLELELGDPRLTYVSDCMIISTEATLNGFKALSRKIHKITADLAFDGFFCRGAITKGKLFHKGRILFGSAYVRAYQLEESVAKYPRIIVDPEILGFFDLSEGRVPLAPAFFGLDSDGIYYQRYWTWHLYPPYAGSFPGYIELMRSHIRRHLERFKEEPRLVEKYQWLREELEKLIQWWKDMGLLQYPPNP